jgi:hypothetical protein
VLDQLALGAGIIEAVEVLTEDELRQAYDRILTEDGP